MKAFKLNEFEYHQPPLYYLAVAGFCSLFEISDSTLQLLSGRYLNLFLALFSFYFIYNIFIQVGWQKENALFGCSVIALLGSHVYQTSLFSNDMLSWLLFWWLFYLLLNNSIKNWLSISLLLILAHYSKTNILVIYPVLLWVLYSEIRKGTEKARHKSMLILLLPVLLALPWYIRNYILYDSFLLLTGSQWHFVSGYSESLIKLFYAPYTFLYRMYFTPSKTQISIFNYMQYLFLFPLIITGVWQSVRKIKNSFDLQVLTFLLITMLAAYLWLAIPTGFTEGRMLFPALPVIIYFICKPIYTVEEKYGLKGYLKYFLLVFVFIPPYIIGFYY